MSTDAPNNHTPFNLKDILVNNAEGHVVVHCRPHQFMRTSAWETSISDATTFLFGKLFNLLVCLWGELNSSNVFDNGGDMTGRYKVGLTCFVTFYTAIFELALHFASDNVADMCDGARRRAARHFGLHLCEPVESYLCLGKRKEKTMRKAKGKEKNSIFKQATLPSSPWLWPHWGVRQ